MSNASLYADTFWSIFNAMIVANSIVIAGISFVISTPSFDLFTNFLVIIGVILCMVWFLFGKRHREFAAYFVLSAREIEEVYLSAGVQTLSRVSNFAQGKPVTFKLDSSDRKRRMSFLARLTNSELASSLIIIAFIAIYIGALFI